MAFSLGALSGVIGGIGSLAGGLLGGSGGTTPQQDAAGRVQLSQLGLANSAYNEYSKLYGQYYWPIEEYIADNYYSDIQTSRPYQERMRDYQLTRGDELVNLANETNPVLDDTKKTLIQRLSEGEDVLADRYRSQASADVTSAYGNQYNQKMRQLQRSGVNPNSGAFANFSNSYGQGQALAESAARTSATRQAEDTSLKRQAQALNYYTNPSMLYNAGNITPSASIGSLIGGASSSSGGSSSGGSGSGGSGIGGITSGLGGIVKGVGGLLGGDWI